MKKNKKVIIIILVVIIFLVIVSYEFVKILFSGYNARISDYKISHVYFTGMTPQGGTDSLHLCPSCRAVYYRYSYETLEQSKILNHYVVEKENILRKNGILDLNVGDEVALVIPIYKKKYGMIGCTIHNLGVAGSSQKGSECKPFEDFEMQGSEEIFSLDSEFLKKIEKEY